MFLQVLDGPSQPFNLLRLYGTCLPLSYLQGPHGNAQYTTGRKACSGTDRLRGTPHCVPQLTGVEAPRIRGPSAVAATLFTLPAGNIGKDTVLITLTIFRRAWHIQQDQLCILGLVEDDTIELHCSVHPPDVGLVPGRRVVQQAAQWA